MSGAGTRCCATTRAAGVAIYERAGPARFFDPHTVEAESAPRLQSESVIICTGGTSRRLPVPGSELTATHSDAWDLSAVPGRCWWSARGRPACSWLRSSTRSDHESHSFEAAPRF